MDNETGISEKRFSGPIFGIEGSYQEICLDNIVVGYGDIQPKNELELNIEGDFENVKMNFVLQGHTQAQDKESRFQVSIQPTPYCYLF